MSERAGVVEYSVSVVDTTMRQDDHHADHADHWTVQQLSAGQSAATAALPTVSVSVLDVNGSVVLLQTGAGSGTLTINNVQPWWPYNLNHHRPAYLYMLQVCLC